MALKVEGIVDGGMDGEETLSGAGRLKALHLAFSTPHDLVAVLGAVTRTVSI